MAQNYQNLLQEALKMRQQSTNFIQQSPITTPPPSQATNAAPSYEAPPMASPPSSSASSANTGAKQAWVATSEPKTAREKASFKNKIPFNEEMYEVLKSSIELLSDRMSTKQPLTPEQAAWLTDAIEIILADAKMFGPPARPVRTAEDNSE